VLSFDRELKRESNRFESMASKVEGSYAKADASFRKMESLEKKITPFEDKLGVFSQSNEVMSQLISQTVTESAQNNKTTLSGFSCLEAKLKEIETSQASLVNRIRGVEEQIQKLPAMQSQEVKSEIVMQPISIKRDKALAALTNTEIMVLEMLSKEGAKTAPEIKERVSLSREHTARLMKKLYEEGYLEREVSKIPFKYSIKKEMENLMQKVERTQS
jgi:MarR family